MNIRPAQLSDARAIAHVHIESWRTTYKGLMPDDVLSQKNQNLEKRTERWKQILTDPDKRRFNYVAEVDEQIVGFANGGPEREGFEGYDGEIYALYLLQSAQGRGIGRSLLQTGAKHLLDDGMTAVIIWVLAENPARKFYQACGGVYLAEKTIEIGGADLLEVAYGWKDISTAITRKS